MSWYLQSLAGKDCFDRREQSEHYFLDDNVSKFVPGIRVYKALKEKLLTF